MHVWGSEDIPGCCSSVISHHFLEEWGSLSSLEPQINLGWLASELQASACLSLPGAGTARTGFFFLYHLAVLCEAILLLNLGIDPGLYKYCSFLDTFLAYDERLFSERPQQICLTLNMVRLLIPLKRGVTIIAVINKSH